MKKKNILISILIATCMNAFAQGVSFEAHTIDDSFESPAGIFVSDLNNDNKPDVISAGMDSNTIAWWKNEGGQPISWSKQIIDSGFAGAISVSAGDIDGDGLTDVLGAAYYGHELAWWQNDGGQPVQWTKHSIKTSFSQAHEIMPVDLDFDGDMDVLSVSAGLGKISWFENDGSVPVTWTEHNITTGFLGARSVDARDIDGDGDIDLAGAALLDNEIAWWRNDGGNPMVFTEITINSSFTYAHKVVIADMDNDGRQDILGTAYNAGVSWWKNEGADTIIWTKQFVGSYSSAVIGRAIDVDLDSDLDIVCAAQTNSGKIGIWYNDGGFPIEWDYFLIENNFAETWPLHYGDIDMDGDIDLVCGGNAANEIRWYENDLMEPVTVSDYNETGNKIKITPNPVKNHIYFQMPDETSFPLKVELFDMTGNHLKTATIGQDNDGIDISSFREGAYLIKVNTPQGAFFKKTIKIK